MYDKYKPLVLGWMELEKPTDQHFRPAKHMVSYFSGQQMSPRGCYYVWKATKKKKLGYKLKAGLI